MTWILPTFLSALLLGIYDFAKKSGVKENAVPVVLLLAVLPPALFWAPLLIVSFLDYESLESAKWLPEIKSPVDHLRLFGKAALVGCSWTLAFHALKKLPLSIASPVRATAPVWTIGLAVLLFSERPSMGQWIGIVIAIVAFISFSLVGKREGIHFHKDQWIWLMVAATLLGSLSGLYDKYLFTTCGYSVATVQAWFSVYLIPVMMPMVIGWWIRDRKKTPFHWRWGILLIGPLLMSADLLYFYALTTPDPLLAVIAPIRRSSVIVSFVLGIWFFKEQRVVAKSICLSLLLIGVLLIGLMSR